MEDSSDYLKDEHLHYLNQKPMMCCDVFFVEQEMFTAVIIWTPKKQNKIQQVSCFSTYTCFSYPAFE